MTNTGVCSPLSEFLHNAITIAVASVCFTIGLHEGKGSRVEKGLFDQHRFDECFQVKKIGVDTSIPVAAAGYDVQKAAITNYSAAIGYINPQYTASITATNNLSVFSAAYYHKVNSQVEAGAKAVYDSKSGNQVGLEVASKYRLDPVSFAKVSFTP